MLPIDFRRRAYIEAITDSKDCFIFSATLDRAANNLVSCRWLCGWIESELKQPRVVFHPELCNLQGTALVKNRATSLKEVAAALCSYTRWLRNSRHHSLLVEGIKQRLDSHLSIKQEERPASHREQSLAVVKAIYGDFGASFFWRTCKKTGQLAKTQLLLSLERLSDVMDLQGAATEVVCWNLVSHGSYEHEVLKMPIGEVIGRTREDCLQRVCTPVLQLLTNRAWVDASLARWTNVTTRFAASCSVH